MKDIYEILPNVMIYIVLGFTFLEVFHFTLLKAFDVSISDKLVESLVVGFTLKKVFDLFGSINYKIDIVCMILSSIILGFIIAKIATGEIFKRITQVLNIRQDSEQYMWRNIMGNQAIRAMFIDREHKIYYYGKIVMIEGHNRNPQILLSEYQFFHSDKLDDYTNKPENTVLIDTATFHDIQIFYNTEDAILDDFKM